MKKICNSPNPYILVWAGGTHHWVCGFCAHQILLAQVRSEKDVIVTQCPHCKCNFASGPAPEDAVFAPMRENADGALH